MKSIDQLWLFENSHDDGFVVYADKRAVKNQLGQPRSFVPGLPKNTWAQNILDAFQAEEGGHIVTEGGEKFDTHTTPFIIRCHISYDCLEVGRGEAADLPTARLLAARAIWNPEFGPLEPEE